MHTVRPPFFDQHLPPSLPPSLPSLPSYPLVHYPPPSSYLEFLHNVLSDIPAPNYALLKYLIRHLHIVSRHHAKNKMNAANLAIVFGPNLFRCVCVRACVRACMRAYGVVCVCVCVCVCVYAYVPTYVRMYTW